MLCAEVGTQEGTTSSTSTGTDSEAEEAKKKRQKVERQRERRAEQKAAQLAGTEWVSQRQPSSPKAVRNKQRQQEQAAATDCGLQWVSKKKDAMPPSQLQNVDTPARLSHTIETFSRQWAPCLREVQLPERIHTLIIQKTLQHRGAASVVHVDIIEEFRLTDEELAGVVVPVHHTPIVVVPKDEGDWSAAAYQPRSVAVRPPIPADIVYGAEQLVLKVEDPGKAICTREAQTRNSDPDEERDTLLRLLTECSTSILDPIMNINPTQKQMKCDELPGCLHEIGGARTPINGCARSKQPKRMSRSVVVRSLRNRRGGSNRYELYHYTSKHGAICAPLEWPWFLLMLHVWAGCWRWLTPISRQCPPNHVQLLFYFTRLRAEMRVHRDNASKRILNKIASGDGLALNLGNPSGVADNSQIPGSNVLVFTTGDIGQNFTLHAVNGATILE